MKTLRIPGGLYAIALPTGERACLLPGSHIATHEGPVALPKDEDGTPFDVLFLDITNVNGFAIVGQAALDPTRKDGTPNPNIGTWLYRGGRWIHFSPDAHGTYPAMFDANGNILVATPERNGSQGWRYNDDFDQPVTGDDTMNADRRIGRELGLHDLWEYTNLGLVTIGQGNTGCEVLIDSTRRLLEPGGTYFIRVRFSPALDEFAVSITKLAENQSVIHIATRAELQSLPIVGQPEPDPHPKPDPEAEPKPVDIPNQLALVTEVRNDLYPEMVGKPLNSITKAFQVTKRVAWRLRHLGIGLVVAKPGSDNNAEGYTSDIVALANGTHFDIFEDGEGKAFPAWSQVPSEFNGAIASRWRAAIDPGVSDGGDPGDENDARKPHAYVGGDHDGGTCDLCGQVKSAAIHHAIVTPPPPPPSGNLDAIVRGLIAAAVAPLSAKIAALEARPAGGGDDASLPSRIALKTAHGKYLSAQEDGSLIADREAVAGWETFSVEKQG